MIAKRRKILGLISEIRNSHPAMVEIFSNGSCLNFHLILRSVFPEAVPYYNMDHVITEIDGVFYDINGVVVKHDGFIPFSKSFGKKGVSRPFTQLYKSVNNLSLAKQD